MNQAQNTPRLPEPVDVVVDEGFDERTDQRLESGQDGPSERSLQDHSGRPARFRFPFRRRSLQHGAYLLQWRPDSARSWTRYNGVMRVERHAAGTTASGDLYWHPTFTFQTQPFRIVLNPDPSPSGGVPSFRRSNYRSYLRVTSILEQSTYFSGFVLKFEKFDFDSSTNSWTNQGEHSAFMRFASPPSNYPSGSTYLEGTLKNPTGGSLGTISMGWISKYLRKATVEIDRVSTSEYPGDNGSGLDWRRVFDAVDWDVNAYESDTNLAEPSGEFWSDAEMHAAMVARRDSSDLDNEWRFHIIAVRRLDSTSRGIMYDASSTDSNNIPREGAGIASHWRIPNSNTWGSVRNQRFGASPAPYFRTAIHELGHALGLYHNTDDFGFMNTTGTIAVASGGTFPANVQWSFNAADAKRLRHMPDPWVRPGMIPFGQAYTTAPISPTDMFDMAGALDLTVEALHDAVPIGAPVRVGLTLTNNTDTQLEVPDSLSLKSEHVSGTVVDPSGTRRRFQSIVRCIDEHEVHELQPNKSLSGDMTLLRGGDGALFPAAGLYSVIVDVAWETNGVPVRVSATTAVMVTPPVDAAHASAALGTLQSPDLLLTLAIGGDHLDDGNAALDRAMDNDVLAPHYAVVAAKQLGRAFMDRKANPSAAINALGTAPIASPSEAAKVAKICSGATKTAMKKAPKTLVATLKRANKDSDHVDAFAEKVDAAK